MFEQATETITVRRDPFGNQTLYEKQPDGTTTVRLRLAADGKTRMIGRLETDQGVVTYVKQEDEYNKYIKLKAWTVHEPLVRVTDFVTFRTPEATYTISSKEALKKGIFIRHLQSSFENKIAVPIRYWDIAPESKTSAFLVRSFGYEWFDELKSELKQPYMAALSQYVAQRRMKTVVYPSREDVFRAFRSTHFMDVKCVIIGSEPYHDGSATGLAYSVSSDSSILPAALERINTELEQNLFGGVNLFKRVDLSTWATQGVLLLNTTLTVENGKPGSHNKIGWDRLTSAAVYRLLVRGAKPVVYMLWGAQARQKIMPLITEHGNGRDLVLTSDPESDDFYGCRHFSKCNDFLKVTNQREIIF